MTTPRLLFRPPDGWVGDVIPFFADGQFHVFYLFDDRDAQGVWRGLDWAHLRTTDFVSFEELPLAVPRGRKDDLDLMCGTGSATQMADGRYAIYYAGINPWNGERGEPDQVVLRTFSDDLVAWEKDADFILRADERWYERDDWRDPFLYRDAEGVWQMLMCARVNTGPKDRRGTFGLATSTDMEHWEVQPPVLTPGTTNAPECPEVWTDGGDAYLIYASYSDRFATRYRRAYSVEGPWQVPIDDALEAPDVYAMKSATDGERRYLMGWLATRAGERDTGHRQWGGDLLVHKLFRRPDGELGVGPVDTLIDAFETTPTSATPVYGEWTANHDGVTATGEGLAFATVGAMRRGRAPR